MRKKGEEEKGLILNTRFPRPRILYNVGLEGGY